MCFSFSVGRERKNILWCGEGRSRSFFNGKSMKIAGEADGCSIFGKRITFICVLQFDASYGIIHKLNCKMQCEGCGDF